MYRLEIIIISSKEGEISDQIDGGNPVLPPQEKGMEKSAPLEESDFLTLKDSETFREKSNSNEFGPEGKVYFHGYMDTIKRYKKQLSNTSSNRSSATSSMQEEKSVQD